MTLRTLPELRRPDTSGDVAFDLDPKALAAWNPNVTAAAEGENSVISILDVIGENWDGTGITARRISGALRSIGEKPVTVQINSPGGNFFEGLAIYNLLRLHPAEVTVQVLGIAASAAAIVAMCGDTVQIAKAGMMMIHNTQWIAIGDRHVMLETHDTMKVFDETIAGLFVDRTGLKAVELEAMLDATTFMSGETAIAKGFADELLAPDSVTTATNSLDELPAAYRLENVLAKAGIPRAERRKLLKEITGGKPGAAPDDDMPSAVETAAVDDDGTIDLSLALARLRLAQA